MKEDNRIVVDLAKVQYAKFFYKSTVRGMTYVKNVKPRVPTAYGEPIEGNRFGTGEPMLEFAKKQGLVDQWEPVLVLQLQANHELRYTGEKAKALWREWNNRIFNKKKG